MSSAAVAVAFVLITTSSTATYHTAINAQPMPDKETCELVKARMLEVAEKEGIDGNKFFCRPLDGSDHLQFMDPYGYKKLQELQKKFNP